MKKLTRTQKGLFIAAGACLVLAAFFKFCLRGFGMTAICFFCLAACDAVFALLDMKKARRTRLALILVLVFGMGCFLAGEIPVLADARSAKDTTADYLIVCGAGVTGSRPSLSLMDRIDGAYDWLTAHPEGKAVLSGGQGPGEDLSEAQCMFDWLTDRGVDPGRLILEDGSSSSRENLENSLTLIAAGGGDAGGRIAVLSSEYHLHRLSWMAEKLGFEAVPVAAPTSNPFIFLNYAIRESFAMWELWVFGM